MTGTTRPLQRAKYIGGLEDGLAFPWREGGFCYFSPVTARFSVGPPPVHECVAAAVAALNSGRADVLERLGKKKRTQPFSFRRKGAQSNFQRSRAPPGLRGAGESALVAPERS